MNIICNYRGWIKLESVHLERKKKIALEEIEIDRKLIKRFMEKYGEEWRKLGED